jgi:hypothetical protein
LPLFLPLSFLDFLLFFAMIFDLSMRC